MEIIKRKKTSIHEWTTFLLYRSFHRTVARKKVGEELSPALILTCPFLRFNPFPPLPEIWTERVLHRNVFMLPPPIFEQGNYRKAYAGLATCNADEEEQEIPFPRNKLFPRLIDPSSF